MRAFALILVLLGAHEAHALLAPSLAGNGRRLAGQRRHVGAQDELGQGDGLDGMDGMDGMEDLVNLARGAPIDEYSPIDPAASSTGRRQWLSRAAATASVAALATLGAPDAALATIGPER